MWATQSVASTSGSHRIAFGRHRSTFGRHSIIFGSHRIIFGSHRITFGSHKIQALDLQAVRAAAYCSSSWLILCKAQDVCIAVGCGTGGSDYSRHHHWCTPTVAPGQCRSAPALNPKCICLGALQLLHQGNAGQLLPMLDASGNSLHQHLLSMIIAGIITGALRLVHQGNAGQLLP